MKIKLDFVTNSSSVCYLIMSPEKMTKKFLIDQGITSRRIDDFDCIKSIEQLITIAEGNDKPCDWIRRATGPLQFWGMNKEWYPIAKEIIKEGKYVLLIDMDRNYYDDLDKFDRIITKLGCSILRKESD